MKSNRVQERAEILINSEKVLFSSLMKIINFFLSNNFHNQSNIFWISFLQRSYLLLLQKIHSSLIIRNLLNVLKNFESFLRQFQYLDGKQIQSKLHQQVYSYKTKRTICYSDLVTLFLGHPS